MQLEFEVINTEVGNGKYPDVIHFANTQAQVFYLDNGELFGQPTNKIDLGEWEDVVFQDEVSASPDSGMSHLELKVLPGWGIIGGYKTGNIHKMIIHEFAWEMGQYLNNGTIKHSNDPVSSFSLSLENPDEKNPEKPGNIAANEKTSLLSPGAKVVFKFGVGDDEPEFEMGTFYVDRSNFQLLSESASADGRNTIGKVLKEQTLDEKHEYWLEYIHIILQDVFDNANIEREMYLIQNTSKQYWFNFTPNTTPYNVLEQVFEILPDWRVKELQDGTIVVGAEGYTAFPNRGHYFFKRNKDIFSRQIVRDDGEVYKRICVHTDGFGIAVYREIQSYEGWNLGANKTMYIQVSNDSKLDEVEAYADEIATRMSNVGKVESFVGPFRPHLQPGDQATIIEEDNINNSLGEITEVSHSFGKSGFTTTLTVDSGGRLGKGLLSDYIKKIAVGSGSKSTSKGNNDIDRDEYANIAKVAKVAASSEHSPRYHVKRLIDGDKYLDPEGISESGVIGWRPDKEEEYPYFVIDFKQRCAIDKIDLFLGTDYEATNRLPEWYKIQYWNGSFWVDLVEILQANIEYEMSHSFAEIETSKIRVITKKLIDPLDWQIWREIEVFGYM